MVMRITEMSGFPLVKLNTSKRKGKKSLPGMCFSHVDFHITYILLVLIT